MGLLDKFRSGLKQTQEKLSHELKRIVTFSPRLTETSIEDLEVALIGADFGLTMTGEIVEAVRRSYETQGKGGPDLFGVARAELEKALKKEDHALVRADSPPTVVSIVGVNGTGKTTTCAKLAFLSQQQGHAPVLAVLLLLAASTGAFAQASGQIVAIDD